MTDSNTVIVYSIVRYQLTLGNRMWAIHPETLRSLSRGCLISLEEADNGRGGDPHEQGAHVMMIYCVRAWDARIESVTEL